MKTASAVPALPSQAYTKVRPEMQSGDIIAMTHRSWKTWYDWQVQAVRFFTQSEYCHVGILWVISGRVFVIESVTPHIRIVPLSLIQKEGFYWMPTEVPMSDEELSFALSMVGVGLYSKWGAMMAPFHRLKLASNDIWECAKFVLRARILSGLDLGDTATPTAVVRKVQELGTPVFFVKSETPAEAAQ
jgi:hypothetical protein